VKLKKLSSKGVALKDSVVEEEWSWRGMKDRNSAIHHI